MIIVLATVRLAHIDILFVVFGCKSNLFFFHVLNDVSMIIILVYHRFQYYDREFMQVTTLSFYEESITCMDCILTN